MNGFPGSPWISRTCKFPISVQHTPRFKPPVVLALGQEVQIPSPGHFCLGEGRKAMILTCGDRAFPPMRDDVQVAEVTSRCNIISNAQVRHQHRSRPLNRTSLWLLDHANSRVCSNVPLLLSSVYIFSSRPGEYRGASPLFNSPVPCHEL